MSAMVVKADMLGGLIYAAMVAYLAAFVALARKRARAGGTLFSLGCVLCLGAILTCWLQAGHPPLQNLFGVFLCLGALAYPLSVFWRRVLRVAGSPADALMGFVLLFPVGFEFQPDPVGLPPALQSPLLVLHVGAYMLAYVVLFKAGLQAVTGLVGKGAPAEDGAVGPQEATWRLVRLGFPLLTLGLVLGAVWGKAAWGDYWQWDPKELWSLAMWLVYVAYFQVRRMFGERRPRLSSALVLGGAVVIVITLSWVNLARLFAGKHSYAL